MTSILRVASPLPAEFGIHQEGARYSSRGSSTALSDSRQSSCCLVPPGNDDGAASQERGFRLNWESVYVVVGTNWRAGRQGALYLALVDFQFVKNDLGLQYIYHS